jgi:hypothetical protein
MGKKLIKILAAVLILVVVAAIIVHFVGDRALKASIETAATKALGVDVALDDVSLSLLRGTLDLSDMVISNPPDYQHPNLLELGTGHVDVDLKSLLGDTVNIEDIRFDGITLVIEQKGLSNNLNEVLASLPTGTEQKEEQEQEQTPSKQLQIANLEVSNVKVKVKLLPIPGRADTLELNLTPIKMTNLGSDEKLDTARLTGKVLAAIAKGVAQQGTDVLPKELIGSITSTLTEQGAIVVETGKKVVEESKELGKDALEKGKGIGEGAVDALKDLGIFGKDDK